MIYASVAATVEIFAYQCENDWPASHLLASYTIKLIYILAGLLASIIDIREGVKKITFLVVFYY